MFVLLCCRCPDSGSRGRMAGPEEDYMRRERLLLLHHSGDRYLVPPAPNERYLPPPDRYLPPPAPAPADRYHPASPGSSDRYNPPPAPAPATYQDRFDRFQDRYQDRYYQDRYASPQSPSYSERSYMCGTLDRYDRYIQSPPATVTPGGPGDPYMRRDLGYHHHYRLPPPPGFYHPVYQRTLPSAPMRHHMVHHRGHVRCCPSLYPQGNVREGSSGGGSARDYVTSPVLPRGRTCSRVSSSSSSASAGTPVEYVGSSGGRYVSTTPPLPRCSSVSDVKSDSCAVTRRSCDSMTLCCSSRRALPQTTTQPPQLLTPHHNNSVW